MEPSTSARKDSSKNPKLVPWEPYKGAVSSTRPIQQQPTMLNDNTRMKRYFISKDKSTRTRSHKQYLNTSCDAPPADPMPPPGEKTQESVKASERNDEQRLASEKLITEKAQLEDQLKFQLKINNELRQLMVATMGDDMQQHVRALNEDKTALAQSIDDYSREVGKNMVSIEDLHIDVDLWRSKFMASSVMCDELITWRVYLVNRFEHAQQVISAQHFRQMRANDALIKAASALHQCVAHSAPWSLDPQLKLDMSVEELSRVVMRNADVVLRAIARRQSGGEMLSEHEMCVTTDTLDSQVSQILKTDTSHWLAQSPCNNDVTQAASADRQMRLLGIQPNCRYKNFTISCCQKCRNNEIKII